MKRTFTFQTGLNRVLSLLMVILMVIGLVPVLSTTAKAEDSYPYPKLLDYTKLDETFASTAKDKFLSEDLADYALAAIKYHIESSTGEYRVAKNLLQLYNTIDGNVVFFFDGCSKNLEGATATFSGYSKNGKRYNTSAVCIVVRADKNGHAYVAYATQNASTMADNVRNASLNGGTPVSITRDGIYNISAVNHQGKYAALNINTYSNSGVRCSTSKASYVSQGSGINIHSKGYSYAYLTDSTRSSTGCFNIGKTYGDDEYNSFMKAVTGQSNAINSTFSSSTTSLGVKNGSTVGITIIDRSNYKENLKTIYGDDKVSGGWTKEKIADTITSNSKQWHEDIVNNTSKESLHITSPQNGAVIEKSTVSVNWTSVDSASKYQIAIRDLTDNPDQSNPADGSYEIKGASTTSYTIKNFNFKDGHKYRIWVGAYDDQDNAISHHDQVEITIKRNDDTIVAPNTPSRDIVLVLDGSGSMSNYEFNMTKEAAISFATQVMDDSANTNIAVMSFGSRNNLFKISSTDSGFYNTLDDVTAAIQNGTRDNGATYMADALLYAESLLENSTADRQIIMLMSDGEAYGYSSTAATYGTTGSFYSSDANVAYNVAKHLVDDNDTYIYTLGFGLYAGGSAEQLLQAIAALHDCEYASVTKVDDLKFGFVENADSIILSDNQILITIACPVEVCVNYGGETLSSSNEWPATKTSFGTLEVSDDHETKKLKLDASNVYDIGIYGTGEGTMTITVKYPGEAKEVVLYKDVPVSSDSNFLFNTDTRVNTTLYASYDNEDGYEETIEGEKTYTGVTEFDVIYMVDEEVYETQTYTIGDTIVAPDSPEKDGYVFAGWEELPETMPAYDVTVTAVWEEEAHEEEPEEPKVVLPNLFTVTVTTTDGGKTNVPNSFLIAFGASRNIKITPDEGYVIQDVLVNGISVGAVDSYKIKAAAANYTVEVIFAESAPTESTTTDEVTE